MKLTALLLTTFALATSSAHAIEYTRVQADKSQIAGLSPYAADPELSVVAKEAATIPRLDWSAESVIESPGRRSESDVGDTSPALIDCQFVLGVADGSG